MHSVHEYIVFVWTEVVNASKAAMKDEGIKKAAMTAMMGKLKNDPNQAQHNKALFSAVSQNKDAQRAAMAAAKDEKVQKAVISQAKKNAPLMKSAAASAFKMGFSAAKNSQKPKK